TPLRERVLRPDGRPWPRPPQPPFRIWPVEKCVDRIIRLIVKRRPQANLPWFMGPLLWLDQMLACWIGNAILRYKFPPERWPSRAEQPGGRVASTVSYGTIMIVPRTLSQAFGFPGVREWTIEG